MVAVLISGFLWLEKESVEVDSELDIPGKPNWGSTCRLMAHCHHFQELGRGGECLDQPVPKVTTKIMSGKLVESAKCMVRLRHMDCVKYVVDKERDRWK